MDLLQVQHVEGHITPGWAGRQCTALSDELFCRGAEICRDYGASGSREGDALTYIASLDKPTSGERSSPWKAGALSASGTVRLSAFRQDNLGFVFQDFNLLDTFTLKDNILLPLVLSNTKLEVMEARLRLIAEQRLTALA